MQGEAAVTSSSVRQQLEYWIAQTSALSDALLESQGRLSTAEGELATLRPLAARMESVQGELRSLSEGKASALVDALKAREWGESMQALVATQDAELARLRQLNAQGESEIAHLRAQLSESHTASASIRASLQMQQAYQSKVAELERSLAAAQEQLLASKSSQLDLAVLHEKYAHLKRVREEELRAREGESGTTAALGERCRALESENASYRSQLAEVAREMDAVRDDLLQREAERERLLAATVQAQERASVAEGLHAKLEAQHRSLRHEFRMARARSFSALHAMRERVASWRAEIGGMLQRERDEQNHAVRDIMARLASFAATQRATQSKQAQAQVQAQSPPPPLISSAPLAAHGAVARVEQMLRDTSALVAQRAEHMQSALNQSIAARASGTGAAASSLNSSALPIPPSLNASMVDSSTLSGSFFNAPPPPLPPLAPHPGESPTIRQFASAAADFSVRDWLRAQAHNSSTIVAPPVALQPPSISSSLNSSFALPARPLPAPSIGFSPRAGQSDPFASAASSFPPLPTPPVPAFTLPSSLASSIRGSVAGDSAPASLPPSLPPSAFSSLAGSTLPSARGSLGSTPLFGPANSSAALAPASLAPAAHAASGLLSSMPPPSAVQPPSLTSTPALAAGSLGMDLESHTRALAQGTSLSRSVHTQRLAEVEAALQAMQEASRG